MANKEWKVLLYVVTPKGVRLCKTKKESIRAARFLRINISSFVQPDYVVIATELPQWFTDGLDAAGSGGYFQIRGYRAEVEMP